MKRCVCPRPGAFVARLSATPVTLKPVAQGTAIPKDLSKLEARAAKVLAPEALAYILAGAGHGHHANAAATSGAGGQVRRRSRRSISTTSGTRMPALVLGWVGVHARASHGELATAPRLAEARADERGEGTKASCEI